MKALGRGIYAVGVVPQELREVLELGFDRVACIHVGRELRIERCQFADSLPHIPQTGEYCLVGVVERGVGLLTQTLHTLGVGEHLLAGSELLVFTRDRPDLLDLTQLKGEQLETR